MAAWHETFFEDDWLVLAQAFPPEQTEQQVDLIVRALALEPGECLLDVGCGTGRIAIPLARRGLRVTGVDTSRHALEAARAEGGGELELVRLDMRELHWDGEFDAAINVFTAFGYFATQAEDELVAAAIARALRPGGRLLIDVANPTAFLRTFAEQAWRELPDGRALLEERRYDVRSGRHAARWIFIRPDGSRRELATDIRTYTAPELSALLERAGLSVTAAYGGWDGSDLGLDSRRLILVAEG